MICDSCNFSSYFGVLLLSCKDGLLGAGNLNSTKCSTAVGGNPYAPAVYKRRRRSGAFGLVRPGRRRRVGRMNALSPR